MSMNIGSSSISSSMQASYGAYTQKLTPETKRKLDEHNIPYNKDITEEKGKRLLAVYDAQNASKTQEQNNASNQDSNQNRGDSLYEKAIDLAKKIGINVNDKEDFQILLTKIETGLKEKIQANQGNMNELQELKGYSLELASIQAQSQGNSMSNNNSNQALMMSLEMLSKYNKNLLNL